MIEFSVTELIAILWAILATVWGAHHRHTSTMRAGLLSGATRVMEHMMDDEELYQRIRTEYKKSGAKGVEIV